MQEENENKFVALLFFVCYILGMNFTNLITDLLQRGYTFKSIGESIGVTGAAVRAMATNIGQQPRWITGDRLISLHKKVMRKYPKVDTSA